MLTDFLLIFLPNTLFRTLSTTVCTHGESEHRSFVLIMGKCSVIYYRVALAMC
jgi:hypothetical protein